ncbi:VOC family protein [Frankia sp. Cr1]|uniref:VOC family protein n=1 Tax=Frankia sp. Cr1 TaxID=3073931 RepID=UPI003A0FE12A
MTGHGRYPAHFGPAWGAPSRQEPAAASAESNAPANTPGIRHITFAVEDIEDVLARLHAHGVAGGSRRSAAGADDRMGFSPYPSMGGCAQRWEARSTTTQLGWKPDFGHPHQAGGPPRCPTRDRRCRWTPHLRLNRAGPDYPV